MRHLFLAIAMLLAVCFAASARQISENEAMLKAAVFGQKAVASRLMSASSTSAMTLAYTQKSSKSTAENCFYVFNRGAADGYIIVAADDRAESILGYSDSGSFNYADMPENARNWLTGYQKDLQFLIDNPDMIVKAASPKALTTSVAPLCKALWDQKSPFNDNCPTYTDSVTKKPVHCYTGDVATAMSQIMYYYKCPAKGNGSHSYTSRYVYGSDSLIFKLSADFTKSTYEWANMTNCYTKASTATQQAAVAKLMSDVGISVDMIYGYNSPSVPNIPGRALANYFGYDKGVSYINRDFYGIDEWQSIIQDELNNKRPIIYRGDGDFGENAFVCDGYNTENYYHFNWGWSGTCNGYYKISALDPAYMERVNDGIGNYNKYQAMTFHIAKAGAGLKHIPDLTYDKLSTVKTPVKLGDTVAVSFIIYNLGNMDYNGRLRFVTVSASGDTIGINELNKLSLPVTSRDSLNLSYTVPKGLAKGVYNVRIENLPDGESTWYKVRNFTIYNHGFQFVVDTAVTFIPRSNVNCNLVVTGRDVSTLSTSRPSSFSFTINNEGADYDDFLILVTKDSSNKIVQTSYQRVSIPSGQTQTVEFNPIIEVQPSNVTFDLINVFFKSIYQFTGTIIATTPKDSISLTQALIFPDSTKVSPYNFQLSATLTNTGGSIFNQMIVAKIRDADNNYVGNLATYFSINPNETKTLTFNDGCASCVPGVKYFVSLLFHKNGQPTLVPPTNLNLASFIVVDPSIPSAIGSVGASANRLFPNPASDVVTIENVGAISGIKVYSVTGAIVLDKAVSGQSSVTLNVAALPAGSYLVRVATSAGITVQHFIKE
jgi:hypothetical protein